MDITAYLCPLTFVRARLALERLDRGTTLVIRLNEGEPLENLPRALEELGYRIIALEPEGGTTHRLTVAKD
ncbi:MAG: sulfurtransferase TusA family protein [Rhodospirillaceae bacterium]